MIRSLAFRMATAMLFAVAPAIHPQAALPSIPAFPFDTTGPVLEAHAETQKPFTVAGERGVLVGQQDGGFEAWLLPVKLLSHLTIEANVQGYTVPIDVNQQAAAIEVRPDRTILTYSHIAFTVRQIMFSPAEGPAGTGPIVLFEFDTVRPTDFILRFTPELRSMWPARNEGVPNAEWVAGPAGHSGYYVLHSDYPDLAGAVTIPGAESGILAPYQERPQVHPVELKLHIDPARDRGRLFPLLMAIGSTPAAAANSALGAALAQLDAGIPDQYAAHAAAWQKLLATTVSIETPDKNLNEAFQWAVVSIEQLKTKALPTNETALVAGYYASGDSARPGFGWFFGRDALYTLYAVNSYGDFALSRSELEFLLARQRDDGKIMHEYSQTAAFLDWRAFPYMYAAADATPLFLLEVLDYVRSSGDLAFLAAHRAQIEKAWAFETSHAPAQAQGGDGIYTNEQGTGWVESWPTGLPHQEIYLALLDQQASAAVAEIEDLLDSPAQAAPPRERAAAIAKTINAEYWQPARIPASSCYAFNRNADGSLDPTATVYPALAWWSNLPGTAPPAEDGSILAHPAGCLQQFAAHTLNTDWGLRDVSETEKYYDGMSYHQGSVWPLFTGWAALAEYRAGQPLAGYRMLMENANLTRAQDLGADTELLSGDFFIPFGRSTSHQLWSSAMVITPTLRGLFGIAIDAQKKTITVNPHLPAQWQDARLNHLALPDGETGLLFSHTGSLLTVIFDKAKHPGWKLRSDLPGAALRKDPTGSEGSLLAIPLPEVEIRTPPAQIPTAGARTSHFRVLRQEAGPGKIVLTVEGLAGSKADLVVLRHKLATLHLELPSGISADSASTTGSVALVALDTAHEDPKIPEDLQFHFPPGPGWQTLTVTLTW